MAKRRLLKLSEEDKQFITDISFLSGYPQKMIVEVYRYMLVDWARKIAEKDGKLCSIRIPYLGNVGIRYEGDSLNVDGTLATEVTSFVAPSSEFKELVGRLHDDSDNCVTELLREMIDESILVMDSDGYEEEL